jgi:hypothetical protein
LGKYRLCDNNFFKALAIKEAGEKFSAIKTDVGRVTRKERIVEEFLNHCKMVF